MTRQTPKGIVLIPHMKGRQYAESLACLDHTEGRATRSARGGTATCAQAGKGPPVASRASGCCLPLGSMAVGLWVCRAAQSAWVSGTRVLGTWLCVSSTALPARRVTWPGEAAPPEAHRTGVSVPASPESSVTRTYRHITFLAKLPTGGTHPCGQSLCTAAPRRTVLGLSQGHRGRATPGPSLCRPSHPVWCPGAPSSAGTWCELRRVVSRCWVCGNMLWQPPDAKWGATVQFSRPRAGDHRAGATLPERPDA